ncbi:tyrosine--tRNA ligase, partial [Candidatus Micrarchaeota archaeon]|nr:tyrosine--tRNA ligase [Candidatus Micrarchaeota archaeon]
MDSETRLALLKGIGQEIVTFDELKQLVETKSGLVAYDGFEPSGLAHLPVGVYRPLLLRDLLKAGVKFKLLLADSFAWINEKVEGDLDNIRVVGRYFLEVWKAAGVDMSKVEVVWHQEHLSKPDYWKKVLLIAKHHSDNRTRRALQIAGRDNVSHVAQLFYPSMQVADVFELDVDICQLGMDQRKANMLAREMADKLKWKKPVALHHRMLLGLDGMSSASSSDERPTSVLQAPANIMHEASIDSEISAKMSKSKPSTCIFVHDSEQEIQKKLGSAFCPAKVVQGNPVLEYCREIIFRAKKEIKIERPAKFGGEVVYPTYAELEADYAAGKLHPLDLKKATAVDLNKLISPIRNHFEKNKSAAK